MQLEVETPEVPQIVKDVTLTLDQREFAALCLILGDLRGTNEMDKKFFDPLFSKSCDLFGDDWTLDKDNPVAKQALEDTKGIAVEFNN